MNTTTVIPIGFNFIYNPLFTDAEREQFGLSKFNLKISTQFNSDNNNNFNNWYNSFNSKTSTPSNSDNDFSNNWYNSKTSTPSNSDNNNDFSNNWYNSFDSKPSTPLTYYNNNFCNNSFNSNIYNQPICDNTDVYNNFQYPHNTFNSNKLFQNNNIFEFDEDLTDIFECPNNNISKYNTKPNNNISKPINIIFKTSSQSTTKSSSQSTTKSSSQSTTKSSIDSSPTQLSLIIDNYDSLNESDFDSDDTSHILSDEYCIFI